MDYIIISDLVEQYSQKIKAQKKRSSDLKNKLIIQISMSVKKFDKVLIEKVLPTTKVMKKKKE